MEEKLEKSDNKKVRLKGGGVRCYPEIDTKKHPLDIEKGETS